MKIFTGAVKVFTSGTQSQRIEIWWEITSLYNIQNRQLCTNLTRYIGEKEIFPDTEARSFILNDDLAIENRYRLRSRSRGGVKIFMKIFTAVKIFMKIFTDGIESESESRDTWST